MKDHHKKFMRAAIKQAKKGMNSNEGGPFGCVVVKDGKIIARAHNSVRQLNDPTAHAEVVAIRKACRKLKSFQLDGCLIYASCEPCPMCLGAIYWSRPAHVYFSATKYDAAEAGFDDALIYYEADAEPSTRKIPFERYELPDAKKIFQEWKVKPDKVSY